MYKIKNKKQTELQVRQSKYLKFRQANKDKEDHIIDKQYMFDRMNNKQVKDKSTYRLHQFIIKKYSKVKLDFIPKDIQFHDPYFIMTYNQACSAQTLGFIDVFNKSGEPIKRINIADILK